MSECVTVPKVRVCVCARQICCAECCTEGGFSYDDVDTWARLRSLTVIKGLQIGPQTRAYLDNFEKLGDVPLYDVMAV